MTRHDSSRGEAAWLWIKLPYTLNEDVLVVPVCFMLACLRIRYNLGKAHIIPSKRRRAAFAKELLATTILQAAQPILWLLQK